MTEPKDDPKLQRVTFRLALLALAVAATVFGLAVVAVATEFRDWQKVVGDHFAAIIGLPVAGTLAFVLVVFLRQTDGPVEFDGLGLHFKGAAGQVVMWIMCFLAIAGAIKLCW